MSSFLEHCQYIFRTQMAQPFPQKNCSYAYTCANSYTPSAIGAFQPTTVLDLEI